MNIKITKVSKDKAPLTLLLTADPSEKLIQKYLNKGYCYTALVEDQVVGVILVIYRGNSAEIINLAVEEKFQRRGIAKKLIEFVQNEVNAKDISKLEIGTGNSSIHQLLLYQKCGFRITKIDFDFFRDNYDEPVFENGIECRDMLRLSMELQNIR